MPLDLRGFMDEPNQWAGLYHAADQLEKRKLRQDQLALQQQSKRAAAGTFLHNYLDPKDYLSGTQYDPMILQGLQTAMQHGAQLAAAGADSPQLMMALGPMVNKLTTYSTNAKNINKQVDDQIKLMRESGLNGYDYSALKDAAMRHAFYKQGPNGQQEMVDPSEVDPSANYLQKAIEAEPEKLTTAAGLDLFAKNSGMQKIKDEDVDTDKFGNTRKTEVHLIGQNWLVPEKDKKGKITGLVPKYDMATDGPNALMHDFTDANGRVTRAPVRLLNEGVFDDMMQRRPDIADYMKGIVRQHINEYGDKQGQKIGLNDPKAKLIARAIAYDELNRRKAPGIENANINKLSPQQISLNVGGTDQFLENQRKLTEVKTRARLNVTDGLKSNPARVFNEILNGNPDYLQGETIQLNGKNVIDVTETFKGGGLKAGRGESFKYKNIYYNPEEQVFTVQKESKDKYGMLKTEMKEIPKNELNKFIYQIAEANGLKIDKVKGQLVELGMENDPDADDFNKRKKSWHDAYKTSAGAFTNPFGKSFQSNQ